MNIPKYRITTPHGTWYEIDAAGCVIRCSNGLEKTNASEAELRIWQITGASLTNGMSFGKMAISIPRLAELPREQLLYKNGNPRYTCVDIDRGTQRTHGNTKVHGIKNIVTLS